MFSFLIRQTQLIAIGCFLCFGQTLAIADGEVAVDHEAAVRGYRLLTEKPVLTSDFTQEIFDQVWRSWPEPLRRRAENATVGQRRAMAFDRYGLTIRPDDDSGKPLQYVVDDAGKWTMNCFSCHGGSVYGTITPGSPNNRFALQTMTEEIRATKFRLGKPFSRMDMGALFIPLGTTHGTTNAVVFGMGLMSSRDADLNVIDSPPVSFTHHDMDAPPWWTFYKRPNIYIDGFAEKGHRGLMQFTLIPENGREFYLENEDGFRDVHAYLTSLRAPKFQGSVDEVQAGQGRALFGDHCATCHGTYGDDWTYPNRRVAIDDVGTDPVRLSALSGEGRQRYAESWFAHAGEEDSQETVINPEGYVAPPLDGIWASAPYFHNGSVPTLWHVLHPADRPDVWIRSADSMDQQRVGLQIRAVPKVPVGDPDVAIRRSHFDTRRFGKSNSGHDYPDQLSESQKTAVLEYLKTL